MKEEAVGKKLETNKVYLMVSTSLNVLFGLIIAYLVAVLIHEATNKKVMLQPAFPIEKPIELGWGDGEIERKNIEKVGELFTLWTMNYTPKNVQKRFYKILPYVSADVYTEVKEKLDAEIYKIKENKITQAFHPSSIAVEKNVITVRGIAEKSAVSKKLDAEPIKVEIFYSYTPMKGFEIKTIKRTKDKR